MKTAIATSHRQAGATPPGARSGRLLTAGFTLIDLLISMAVFAMMMTFLIGTVSSAQRAWSQSLCRVEMFENARLALDLIARDLQSVYYVNGKVPFWHKPITDASNTYDDPVYRNEMIAFICATSVPHSDTDTYENFEVKYQVYCTASMSDGNAGWLRRSVTGDSANDTGFPLDPTKNPYHFQRTVEDPSNPGKYWDDAANVATWGDWPNDTYKYPVVDKNKANDSRSIFTQGSGSSGDYQKLIPNVTSLEFTCFDMNGNVVSDKTTVAYAEQPSPFPFMVQVKLTLLDRIAWEKWSALGGTPNNPMVPALGAESAEAMTFRQNNERTFTKLVLIGDRGQYQ